MESFFPGYSNNTGPMLGIEYVEGYAGSAMGKRLVCGEHVLRGNMTRSKQFVANNQAFSFAHHEPFQFRYFYKMSVHKTITSSPRNNRGLPRLYYELMEFMAVHKLFLGQNSWVSDLQVRSLPGWWFQPTPLKNMNSSVGMIIPNIWKNKKCSKPPTRFTKFTMKRSRCLARFSELNGPFSAIFHASVANNLQKSSVEK